MEKYTGFKQIVTLAVLGEYIVAFLPVQEGHTFCKNALSHCWKWIEKQEIEIENLYDCLDSPEEIDLAYYEDKAETQEEKVIYRYLFHIVAYITKEISIINKIDRPQYLDYLGEDFFQTLIKQVTDKYGRTKSVIEKTLKYCDNKAGFITREEIIKEVIKS